MSKDLFSYDYSVQWPSPHEFPINEETFDYTVKSILLEDVSNSKNYLIVTGFTSLSNLVEFFGSTDYPKLSSLRVVLGFEPEIVNRKKWPNYDLSAEVKNYWLKQNVSITLCGPILNLIEEIVNGRFEFRLRNSLHAKIYVGETHAILGSANFSKNGITKQLEANIRVGYSTDEANRRQYESIKLLAENFYAKSENYNDSLIDLLQRLLKDVTWEEALARAVAEIIAGEWLKDYPELYQAIMSTELWPAQQIGLAKAMYIIQNQGNVLLADPTGSGKTRMATALAYTVYHWLIANGNKSQSNALIICPKQVIANWKREESDFKLFNKIQSMAFLSTGSDKNQEQLKKDIQKAGILIIDEAHNLHNPTSKRSKGIVSHSSKHVILSTATPINKKVNDLLRMVELLDIDNLSDAHLQTYRLLKKSGNNRSNPEYLETLKNYINQFIVRRTKKQLNEAVSREPEKYKNRLGKTCKYPKAVSKTYQTNESKKDQEIAARINQLCSQLSGVINLQNLKCPSFWNEEERKKFFEGRVKSAPALAAYHVKFYLRSSTCSLYEHILGTQASSKKFKFLSKKNESIGTIANIHRLKKALPSYIDHDSKFLPDWVKDLSLYTKKCEQDIAIYEEIILESNNLSNQREIRKVKMLYDLAAKYGKVIGFDSTVITLEYFKSLAKTLFGFENVIVAAGHAEKDKEKIREIYSLEHNKKEQIIALCSDAMSEGINLQSGQVLVLLGTPSVLRKIEQVIGRIERMDSEHDEIYLFWPNDTMAFSISSDKKLFDILWMTGNLIGTNVEIPEILYEKYFKEGIDTTKLIQAYNELHEKELDWEGVQDSFQVLQDLVEGKTAIIPKNIYPKIKDTTATIKTRISFIESKKSWGFFAMRGDASNSPRWYFIDEAGNITTDFIEIADTLRACLKSEFVQQEKWNQSVVKHLENKLLILKRKEIELLPNKKKRALKKGKDVLEYIFENNRNTEVRLLSEKLLSLFNYDQSSEFSIDFNHYAELWLLILNPVLENKKNAQVRKRIVLSINDIKAKEVHLTKTSLETMLENCKYSDPLETRIASCIIAYSKNGT